MLVMLMEVVLIMFADVLAMEDHHQRLNPEYSRRLVLQFHDKTVIFLDIFDKVQMIDEVFPNNLYQ